MYPLNVTFLAKFFRDLIYTGLYVGTASTDRTQAIPNGQTAPHSCRSVITHIPSAPRDRRIALSSGLFSQVMAKPQVLLCLLVAAAALLLVGE